MRVNRILSASNFKGSVKMDKKHTTRQISSCPKAVQESLIGNINTLNYRLKNNTPYNKHFNVEFDVYHEKYSKYHPTNTYGVLTIQNESGKKDYSEVYLSSLGSYFVSDDDYIADGETIWQKGFKDITERISTDKFYQENSDNILSQKERKEARDKRKLSSYEIEIYDRIKTPSDRIYIDKLGITTAISRLQECGEEARESLIGNINTLIDRIENETSKEKSYNITAKGGFSGDFFYHYFFDLRVDALVDENEYFAKSIVIKSDKQKTVNGEEIYQILFKPLTEAVLWDGYHHLPFENSFAEKEIFEKLE